MLKVWKKSPEGVLYNSEKVKLNIKKEGNVKRLFLFHYVTVLLLLSKTSLILKNIPNIMMKFSEKLLDTIPSLKQETFQVLTIGKYSPINIFDSEKKTNKFEN